MLIFARIALTFSCKLSDELVTLNQANAWRFLFKAVEDDTFSLSKPFVCHLHHIAAKEEALSWGSLS